MEKVISEVILTVSLVLGAGISAPILHNEVRKLAIEALVKKQSSLSAFTKKLTR